jgi:hypothetical protein
MGVLFGQEKEATPKCKLINHATKETQKGVKHSRKLFYSIWKAPYIDEHEYAS